MLVFRSRVKAKLARSVEIQVVMPPPLFSLFQTREVPSEIMRFLLSERPEPGEYLVVPTCCHTFVLWIGG